MEGAHPVGPVVELIRPRRRARLAARPFLGLLSAAEVHAIQPPVASVPRLRGKKGKVLIIVSPPPPPSFPSYLLIFMFSLLSFSYPCSLSLSLLLFLLHLLYLPIYQSSCFLSFIPPLSLPICRSSCFHSFLSPPGSLSLSPSCLLIWPKVYLGERLPHARTKSGFRRGCVHSERALFVVVFLLFSP